MAANRQERELMRQRGAATRQIKDLEFQLVLPGQPIVPKEPLSPQKSRRSRRTPQTRKVLGPRSSTRKPATVRKKGAGKPLSSDVPKSGDKEGVQGTLPTQSDREGKATKKRKIGVKRNEEMMSVVVDEGPVKTHEEQDDLPKANETTSQSAILQAHGKKRKKRKSIGQNSRKKPRLQTVDKDPNGSIQPAQEASRPVNHQQDALVDSQNGEIKAQSQSSAEILAIEPENLPQDSAQDQGAEEAQNLTVTSSKSAAERKPRRKKRKCIGQQRPRRKVNEGATVRDSVPSARPDVADAASKDQDGSSTVKKSRGRPKKFPATLDVSNIQDEVLQGTNSTDVRGDTRSARGRGRSKKISSSANVDVQNEVLTDINNSNVTPNPRSARGRGRPRKAMPVDAVIRGDDEDGDNERPRPVEKAPTRKRGRPKLNVPTEASESATAVKQQRVRKKNAKDPEAIDGKIPRVSRKLPKNSMPITVSHMSTNDALGSDNEHPDSQTNSSAFPKNDSVNAVDVLAQICREMVSKSNASLGEAAKSERNKSKKAALERKRKNIETHGEELENRLFQLTETLDNNLALSARVRRADNEEKALRAELISLQEERQSIAQQATEVEEANAKSNTRAKLAALLRDIEAAVRRGREMDVLQHAKGTEHETGNEAIQTRATGNLDYVIKHVGEDVNSISEAGGESGGGLLDRVKSINALLEEAIAA